MPARKKATTAGKAKVNAVLAAFEKNPRLLREFNKVLITLQSKADVELSRAELAMLFREMAKLTIRQRMIIWISHS